MNSSTFNSLPNSIFAYWVSKSFVSIFSKSRPLSDYGEPKQGIATADNNRFLRQWFEVSAYKEYFSATDSINAFYTGKKWFPYNKGGEFRKWYGNQDYVINYYLDGKELKEFKNSVLRNPQFYFNESLSWSKVSGGNIAFRYYPNGFLFDVAGCSIFVDDDEKRRYINGIINSSVANFILKAISPTINYEVGQIANLPIIESLHSMMTVNEYVENNISICKEDWDSFEESWNFKKHPLI